MDDEETEHNDEGQVKVIIDHPLMKTVYAIGYDANKRKLIYEEFLLIKIDFYFI
jgi:hypothetical protein